MDRYATTLAVVNSDDVDVAASDLPTELKGLEKQFVAGEVDVVRVVQPRNSLSSTAAFISTCLTHSARLPRRSSERQESRSRVSCVTISK